MAEQHFLLGLAKQNYYYQQPIFLELWQNEDDAYNNVEV